MARPIRIEYEHAYYHITTRGNSRRNIFRDDFDRDMLIEVIDDAYYRFGFIIHAFVLMDNHYHLLMETPNTNLCASMRHINGVYTQAFNRRHKVVGHLFQGRYKAFVVDRDAYYLELIRYIHLNPWRAKMVRTLGDFRYSGHRALLDKRWAVRWKNWFDREMILGEFGRKEKEAIVRYREFVNAGKGKPSPLKNAIGGYALGDRQFADRLWNEYIEGRDDKELTGAKKLKLPIEVSRVLSIVSDECGVKPEEIFNRRRGQPGVNIARGMALNILNRHSGMTQREIGELAGGVSRKAVSEAVLAFGRILEENEELRKSYDRILTKLF
jgi:REP element-mobilizing transposase RayT